MDNPAIETIAEATEVEQPKKPKREKRVPGRKRGVGKKPFEKTSSLQPGYALQYYNEKRNVPILCDNCGRETTKAKLHRHVKTLYCFRHTKDPGGNRTTSKSFCPNVLKKSVKIFAKEAMAIPAQSW